MAPSATELAGMLARGAVRSAGPVGAFAAAMAPKDTGGGELTEPLGDGVRWRHHRDESSGGIEVRDPETGAWTPRPDLGRAARGPDGRIMVHPPRDRGFPARTQPPVQTPGFPAEPPERPRPPEGASKPDVPNHTGSPAPRPEGADVETFPDQSGEFGEWNVQASGDPKRTVKGGIMPETPTKPVQWFDPDRHPEIGQAHAEWMKSDAYRELEHRREGGQPTRPAESPVWKSMKNYRVDQGRQVKTNGLQGKKLRKFQWDNKHLGEIEVLDHGGNHLGVIHPLTGAWIKGKNPSHKNDRSMLDTDGRPVPV